MPRVAALFACALGLAFPAWAAETTLPVQKSRFTVLVFTKTLGYRHASIADGVVALRELGTKSGFDLEATEDSAAFSAANLRRFKVVVLLSVTGDVFNDAQETAFKDYLLGGGGVAAIHGALFGPKACEENWAWLGEAMCATFKNHSAVVPAAIVVEDRRNPSTTGLPERWQRTDEWYNTTASPRGRTHVLATLDESTYQGGTLGADHPIAWCHRVGQGRFWYTALGHTPSTFAERLFRQHLRGGILLAAGVEPGDFSSNYASVKK